MQEYGMSDEWPIKLILLVSLTLSVFCLGLAVGLSQCKYWHDTQNPQPVSTTKGN